MALIRQLVLVTGLAGAGALVYACSSKGSTNPPPTYTISKLSGDNQVGSANAALAANLVVTVVDQNSAPAAGLTVTWSAATGGGSVTSGTSQTDASGHAAIGRTLGPAAGLQTTTASLSAAAGSPISFTSISQIGGAFQIVQGTGNLQTDTVFSTLALPFQVLVQDHTGAPVPGVVVSFTVTSGGGVLSQNADTSDAGGVVTTSLTFPSVIGLNTVQAAVTGLVGSPVTFSTTAIGGNAVSIGLAGVAAQVAPVNGSLPVPLAVLTKDAYGNPTGGVTVHWTSTTGLLSATTTQTISGVASVTKTLGAVPGVGYDTATATGLTGSPVAFTDTAAELVGITVADDHFTPQFDTVGVGTFVKFTWTGAVAHTVTWNAAPAATPAGAGPQQTGTLTVRLTNSGNYAYYCQIHGSPGAGMYGTIHTR